MPQGKKLMKRSNATNQRECQRAMPSIQFISTMTVEIPNNHSSSPLQAVPNPFKPQCKCIDQSSEWPALRVMGIVWWLWAASPSSVERLQRQGKMKGHKKPTKHLGGQSKHLGGHPSCLSQPCSDPCSVARHRARHPRTRTEPFNAKAALLAPSMSFAEPTNSNRNVILCIDPTICQSAPAENFIRQH